jgi:radical SAM protein with 4Fe4S-binding SPASM domain
MINISRLYCGLAGQSDELRYSTDDKTGPVVVFNCTYRCNLKCDHCYSSSESTTAIEELTTSEGKKLVEQLAEIKCPVVLFSGGEALLRPDIFELLAEAKKIGLRTVLSTNGTLINSKRSERIIATGVSYVGISVDGPENFHDNFRNSRGSLKAAIAGIKNCQAAGLRTGLRFTITKQNAKFIPFAFELAAELSIRRICFYHLIRSGRAARLTEAPSAEDTRRALDCIIEKTSEAVTCALVDEALTVDNHADGPYLLVKMQQENSSNLGAARKLLLANGGNRIGEKIVAIDPQGNVHPDQFWTNYSFGNIKEKSFKDIWLNNKEPVLYKLRNKDNYVADKCKKCRWFEYCKGNFRFTGSDPSDENWLLEPACYLTESEIKN